MHVTAQARESARTTSLGLRTAARVAAETQAGTAAGASRDETWNRMFWGDGRSGTA